MRQQEQLEEHTKMLPPLKVGDRVQIQNQTKQLRPNWLVIEVRQFHQYLIKIDGSGGQTLRNRKFLRKFTPVYQPSKRTSLLEDIACLPPSQLPNHGNTTQYTVEVYGMATHATQVR